MKKTLVLSLSLFLLVACQSGEKTDTGLNLDAEEIQDLERSKKKVGGSYSKLGELYKAKRYRELLSEASKILSKNEFDLKALSILGIAYLESGKIGGGSDYV